MKFAAKNEYSSIRKVLSLLFLLLISSAFLPKANASCCKLTFGFEQAGFDTPTRATRTCPTNYPHARGITACETLPTITGPRPDDPCYVKKRAIATSFPYYNLLPDKIGVLVDGPSFPLTFQADTVSGVCCDTPVSSGSGGTPDNVCPPGSVEYDPLPTKNPCAGATTCDSPTTGEELQALINRKPLICLCGGETFINTYVGIWASSVTIGCVGGSSPCVFSKDEQCDIRNSGCNFFDIESANIPTAAFFGIEFRTEGTYAMYINDIEGPVNVDIVNCTFTGGNGVLADGALSSVNIINSIFQDTGRFAISGALPTVYASTFQNTAGQHISYFRHDSFALCLGENSFDDDSANKFSPPSLKDQCAP